MCGIRHWYCMTVNMFLWHPASIGNHFLRRFCRVYSKILKRRRASAERIFFCLVFNILVWSSSLHLLHCWLCHSLLFSIKSRLLLSTYTEFSLLSAPLSYDKGKPHRCDKRKYSVAVFIVLILNHMSMGKKETLICFRLVLNKFAPIGIGKRFARCMERNNLLQEIFLSGVKEARGGGGGGD